MRSVFEWLAIEWAEPRPRTEDGLARRTSAWLALGTHPHLACRLFVDRFDRAEEESLRHRLQSSANTTAPNPDDELGANRTKI